MVRKLCLKDEIFFFVLVYTYLLISDIIKQLKHIIVDVRQLI